MKSCLVLPLGMVHRVPAVVAVLVLALVPAATGVAPQGMAAAGEGHLSNCGALDIIVPAHFALRGHAADDGWVIEAAAVPDPPEPCIASTMVGAFTGEWDPAAGGCLVATFDTLCLEDPVTTAQGVRYDLRWCSAFVCATGTVDAVFFG